MAARRLTGPDGVSIAYTGSVLSYVDRYPDPLPGGRAIMRVDLVIEGQLVDSHTEGSPASMATIKAHAGRVNLAAHRVVCPRCGRRVYLSGHGRLRGHLTPVGERCDDTPRCADCGAVGEMTGHMECQYPRDHDDG